MKHRLIPALILISFLTACDPAKMLIFKTEGNKNVSITIYASKYLVTRNLDEVQSQIILHIPTDSVPHCKIEIHKGIGPWSDDDISRLSGLIDSIIINNSTGRLALKDTATIRTYLMQHRGPNGTIIRIKAK